MTITKLVDLVRTFLSINGYVVHGNGFVQIELPEKQRLHIWPEPFKSLQKVPSIIHDHRFGFRSKVLYGVMTNTVWSVNYHCQGQHELTLSVNSIERQAAGGELVPTGLVVKAKPYHEQALVVGNFYTMRPLVFHSSLPIGFTIALMTKLEILPTKPRVLLPAGKKPDNNFTYDKAYFNQVVDRALSILENDWHWLSVDE